MAMKEPGLSFDVEAFEDCGEVDRLITIRGFSESKLYVQITCDYSYEESLRNEMLLLISCYELKLKGLSQWSELFLGNK